MMKKIKNYIVILIGLLMIVPMNVQGQSVDEAPVILYSGTPKKYEIADIVVTGVDNMDPSTLIGLSGLTVGQIITVPGDEISTAMKRLWKNGLFANVKIIATKIVGSKIYLEISIEQRPKIKDIIYHGVKKGEITELEDKIGLIRGSQVTPNILDRSEILIRRYYNEKGYDNAEIRVQQQEEVDQDGLVYVDIFIDKKERVKVNSIVLQGNSAVDDKMLKKVMKKTNEKRYFNDFLRTKKFVEDEFENDKENIINKYNELGYRDAYIVSDSIAHNQEDNTVDIYLTVDEGNRYYKADRTKKGSRGTGLGLSIVKEILENHDMSYGVKSVKNKGTTFYFEINKTK